MAVTMISLDEHIAISFNVFAELMVKFLLFSLTFTFQPLLATSKYMLKSSSPHHSSLTTSIRDLICEFYLSTYPFSNLCFVSLDDADNTMRLQFLSFQCTNIILEHEKQKKSRHDHLSHLSLVPSNWVKT